MEEKNKILLQQAEKAKNLYKIGLITRSEAEKEIKPFIENFNEKATIIAKKYNQKPKLINFVGYVR